MAYSNPCHWVTEQSSMVLALWSMPESTQCLGTARRTAEVGCCSWWCFWRGWKNLHVNRRCHGSWSWARKHLLSHSLHWYRHSFKMSLERVQNNTDHLKMRVILDHSFKHLIHFYLFIYLKLCWQLDVNYGLWEVVNIITRWAKNAVMWEAHNPFLNLASTLFSRKVSFRYQPKSQECCIWGRMGRGVHLLYVVKMSTVPTKFTFCSYIC